MFSFKKISFAATVALASYVSAGPIPLPGFAAAPNAAAAASGATSSAVAAASGISSSASAVAATKAAAVSSSVVAATSSAAAAAPSVRALVDAQADVGADIELRDLLDLDADADVNAKVGRDLLDIDAAVDADVEVRGQQTLIALVDQAVVDLTGTAQALRT